MHLGDRKKVVTALFSCGDHYMFLCETAVEWTGKKSVQYFKRFHFDWGKRIEVEKGYQASNKDHIKVVMSAPAEAAGSS